MISIYFFPSQNIWLFYTNQIFWIKYKSINTFVNRDGLGLSKHFLNTKRVRARVRMERKIIGVDAQIKSPSVWQQKKWKKWLEKWIFQMKWNLFSLPDSVSLWFNSEWYSHERKRQKFLKIITYAFGFLSLYSTRYMVKL